MLTDASLNPEIKNILDFLFEMEKYENEIKTESYTYQSHRNEAFFFLSVPNEVVALEVF